MDERPKPAGERPGLTRTGEALLRAPAAASAAAIVLTLLAALGWWLDIDILKSMIPGQRPMSPVTVVLIVALGAGLLLTPGEPRRPPSWLALGCAGVVVLTSGMFLFAGEVGLGPTVTTSLVLLALGIALGLLQFPRPPVLALGALSVFAVALSFHRLAEHFTIVGDHGHGAGDLFAPMALNTALALCLLAGPGLFLHPLLPYAQRIFAADRHGWLLRRVMPWGVLAPALLAVIIEAGVAARSYNADFAAIAGMALLSAIATGALWRSYEGLRAAEAVLQHDREQQTTLRRMLETILRGDSLEETLGACLDQLLAVPSFAVLPRGGIHLMADDGRHLRLVVARGLPAGEAAQCHDLPLDRCLCGKAAANGKVVFASHVDDGHEVNYPGIVDHSHYCVPLVGNRREVIGVLALYLPAGTQRDPEQEGFLTAVTDILAGFVLRWSTEQDLKRHREHLEELVAQRTADLAQAQAIAHVGSWQLDIVADKLTWSEETYRIFGVQLGQPMNLAAFLACIHPDDLPRVGEAWNSALAGAPYDVEHRILVDGRTKWVRERAEVTLAGGQAVACQGAVQDITELKHAESAREAALVAAQGLARAKSEFLANMSHEIRTPLNAVIGFARIGMRENQGRKSGETCGRIFTAGEHLLGVINDILDFSKIEAGKLAIEARPLSLASAMDHVMSFLADSAAAKGLTLKLSLADDLPAWVRGDTLRLNQVLVNLIGNAIKFTDKGEVSLAVGRTDDLTSFSVTDTGIGIGAEQVGRLFTAFEQADGSTTRQYGGTGLGLAISRQLAHLMGGDIEVRSTPGQGSTFTLRLPLPACAPPARPDEPLPAGGIRLAGVSVLAAEDVGINRMILADLLEHEGARVAFAENGREAIDRVAASPARTFDVVLMDIQMPVMDGLEATPRLRELAPDLPVIGLTANALAEERDKSRAAGMVEHVTKPIDIDTLVTAILRHLPAPPVPVAVPAVAPADGIDWAALAERFNGRHGFIDKLLNTVLSTQAETPARLREAARRQDMAAMGFIGHSLKGMAGNIEAPGLHDLARRLQDRARGGDAGATYLATQVADRLDALLASLRQRIDKAS